MDTGVIDGLLEIVKLLVPAAAAILGVKYTLNAFTEKEIARQKAEMKIKETEIILPIRLQAYERICMLIERISPQNLVPRVNKGSMTAPELQRALMQEIRNEVNHNLSQQVYISPMAWKLTKQSAEAVKGLVLACTRDLPQQAVTGNDLARKILEATMALDPNPIEEGLNLIKKEIQETF